MKRVLLVAVLGLSLALNATIAGIWLAQGRSTDSGSMTRNDGCPIPRLDLTTEERQAVQPIREHFKADRLEQRARLLEMRARLAPLLIADSIDRPAVDTLLGEMSEIQARLQQSVVDRVLSVRAALTPERRALYDEMIVPHVQAGSALQCDCDCSRPARAD